MKVLITGGHISPAIAVIEKLKDEKVFYAGRKYTFEGDKAISLEYQEITKMGIPFFEISTARLQRRFTRHTLISLLKLPAGFFSAYKIIKKVKPDVILAFGSYVSIPVGITGKILNVPLVIHEQTFDAGYSNKMLSRFADKICISWKSSEKYFPKDKIVLTGNPLREEVINASRIKPEKNLLYVTGGSAGSHFINFLVECSIEKLLQKFTVVHQTGASQKYSDFEKLMKKKNESKNRSFLKYKPYKFLNPDDAAKMMAKATIVVGRSGINTVSELIYLKKPALLIPLPFAQHQEQLKNAEFIKSLGLAEDLNEDVLSPKKFTETLLEMYKNINTYRIKRSVLSENAAKDIVAVLRNVT